MWVLGGVDRETGQRFLVPCPGNSRSGPTLVPIIQRWILPGTTVYSDCWGAYNTLMSQGYVPGLLCGPSNRGPYKHSRGSLASFKKTTSQPPKKRQRRATSREDIKQFHTEYAQVLSVFTVTGNRDNAIKDAKISRSTIFLNNSITQ